MALANALDGIPLVADAITRDALFPLATRVQDQRVFNKTSGNLERWSGSTWVVDLSGASVGGGSIASAIATANAYTDATRPQGTRTLTLLSTYLLDNAVFNVKDYGALGDGATDDTAAIKLAIAAAVAAGGGIVHVPPGTYISNPDSGLTYVPAKVMIRGDGPGRSILKRKTGSTAHNLLYLGDVSAPQANVACMNLTLDGNRASTTPVGSDVVLYMQSVQGFILSNLEIKNAPFFGFSAHTSSYGVVDNIVSYNHNRDGFTWSEGCSYLSLNNIVSHDTGDDAFALDMETTTVHHITVTGLTCYRGGLNSDGTGPGGSNLKIYGDVHHVSISGATLDNAAGAGVSIISSVGGSPSHLEITGLKVSRSGQLGSSTNKQNVLISGAATYVSIAGTADAGAADGVKIDSGCSHIKLDMASVNHTAGHGFSFDGTGNRLGKISGRLIASGNAYCGLLATAIDRLVLIAPQMNDNNTSGSVAAIQASGLNVSDITTLRVLGGDTSQYNTGATNKQVYGFSITGTACVDVTVTGHAATVATAANGIFVQTLPTGTYRFAGCAGLSFSGKDLEWLSNGTGTYLTHAWGTGSPEGVLIAAPGSTYKRTDGGAGNLTFYVKASGTGNTNWVALLGTGAAATVAALTATGAFAHQGTTVGLYNVTPVVRAGAITTPNTQTASYVQADVTSLKTAIDAIRVALTNIGVTA